MSHYTVATVEFKEAPLLVKALLELGYREQQIEMHGVPGQLFTYNGIPQPGMFANVIVRREHIGELCNDIGFLTGAEPKAYICDYAKHGSRCRNRKVGELGGHGEKFLERLSDEYGAALAIDQAVSEGLEWEKQTDEKGRIKVFVGAN